MSLVQNPLIGVTRQKIGGVIFQTWKGKNVLRTKPVTVANPQTLPQQQQRSKMRFLVGIMRLVQASLVFAFKEMAIGKTLPNAFISANMPAIDATDPLNPTIVPADFKASKGTLLGVSGLSVTNPSGDDVQFDWTDNSNGSTGLDSDKLCVLGVQVDGTKAKYYTLLASRGDVTTTIAGALADYDAGQDVYFYAFFARANAGKASDSVYGGAIAN